MNFVDHGTTDTVEGTDKVNLLFTLTKQLIQQRMNGCLVFVVT